MTAPSGICRTLSIKSMEVFLRWVWGEVWSLVFMGHAEHFIWNDKASKGAIWKRQRCSHQPKSIRRTAKTIIWKWNIPFSQPNVRLVWRKRGFPGCREVRQQRHDRKSPTTCHPPLLVVSALTVKSTQTQKSWLCCPQAPHTPPALLWFILLIWHASWRGVTGAASD